MKTIIIFAQFCLVLISTLQAKINFIRHDINTDLPSAYWVHAVDMDGDSDLDLVSGANWGVDWWENSVTGSFTRHDVGYLEGVWSVHAADYDNDGDVDVVACAPASQQVVLWERNGSNFKEIIIEENVR